jgi:predicted flap endonuclease-1-like 5' DNA nuclease
MQYLVATYWMWFVVALLAGGVVGFWLRWRLGRDGGSSHALRWGTAAFLVGLVVAVLYWLPRRAGLYLETLLLLSFWYAIGGLLGVLLRGMTSGEDKAQPAVKLAERAQSAVRAVQDKATATPRTVEEARLAEAKAAEGARVAAAAKVAEDARIAAAKAAEGERLAAEAKAAEDARAAAAAKAAEEARLASEAKAAEGARAAAAAKAPEEARLAAEAKAAEDARAAAAAKVAEEARLAAEAKAAEDARVAAAAKAAEDAKLAADAKSAEEARAAAAAKAADAPAAAAAATSVAADAGAHPGSRPAGIAAPAESEADDLKWIKGIGPKNEKACNALGIYQFRQIADWTPDEAVWIGHHMAFPGRIEREHWIAQARLLASGGETAHSSAVKSGDLVVDDSADEPLDQAAADQLASNLPAAAAAVEGEDKHAGRRPFGLSAAIGEPDNLKKIRGIGPQNERRLHALGIWHFSQIAGWSEDNVKWVGSYLAFAGRIDREKWIAQARDLAAGKDTEFSRRVAAGKVATSKDDGAS